MIIKRIFVTLCSVSNGVFSLAAELYKMVCEPDETDLDIHIPAVMLPHDAGLSLENILMNNSSGAFSEFDLPALNINTDFYII